ncbi:MAG: GtrA family protein [Sulfurimonas sp.]|nr:GtrA family protein [Sulfurimonas sp.]
MNIKNLFLKLSNYQIIRYGLTGGISTLIHISIASSYIYLIDSDVLIANTLGFCIAFIFSYSIQSLFVFKHKLKISKTIKYFLVQLGALMIAYFSSNIFAFENLYIQTLVISFLLPLVTFFIHKSWTFKITREEKTPYATK